MRLILVEAAWDNNVRALQHYLPETLRLLGVEVETYDLRTQIIYHQMAQNATREAYTIGRAPDDLNRHAGEALISLATEVGAAAILTLTDEGLHPEILERLRRRGIATLLWQVAPGPIPSRAHYDRVWEGESSGVTPTNLLLPPYLPIYRPLAASELHKETEVVFFGPVSNDNIQFLDGNASLLQNYSFKVLGEGWAELSNLTKAQPSLNPQRLAPRTENQYLASSQLVLSGGDFWSFINAAASGTFQLSLASETIREHFQAAHGYQPLTNPAELANILPEWLGRLPQAAAAAARLREKVLREHSLESRLHQLLADLPVANPTPPTVVTTSYDPLSGALASSWSQPKDEPTVSLCIVARDEEDLLPGCLASVRGLVDEIILVDTGSTDKTMEVAKRFGAEIIQLPWEDDFSAPRNAALERATSDWILILDADERLLPGDDVVVRSLLKSGLDGFFADVLNFSDLSGRSIADTGTIFRLFRNSKAYRFTGRVHEQIFQQFANSGGSYGYTGLQIIHYGYARELLVKKEKLRRNMELLEQEDEDNPFTLLNLAREYQRRQDAPMAAAIYQRVLSVPGVETFFYYPFLTFSYIQSLIALELYEDALDTIAESLKNLPNLPELYFLKGSILLQQNNPREAFENFLWSVAQPDEGSHYHYRMFDVKAMAWLTIARLYRSSDLPQKAIGAYNKALEVNPWLPEALNEIGEVLLTFGEPEEVKSYLEALVKPANAQALQTLLFIFHNNGYHEIAADYAQRIVNLGSADIDPLLRLACLMYVGRYLEAVQASIPLLFAEPGVAQRARFQRFLAWIFLDKPAEAAQETSFFLIDGVREAAQAMLRTLYGESPATVADLSHQEVAELLQRLAFYRHPELIERASPLLEMMWPDISQFSLFLGKLLAYSGHYRPAITHLQQAAQMGSLDSDGYRILERLAQRKGYQEEAKTFGRKAQELEAMSIGI